MRRDVKPFHLLCRDHCQTGLNASETVTWKDKILEHERWLLDNRPTFNASSATVRSIVPIIRRLKKEMTSLPLSPFPFPLSTSPQPPFISMRRLKKKEREKKREGKKRRGGKQ